MPAWLQRPPLLWSQSCGWHQILQIFTTFYYMSVAFPVVVQILSQSTRTGEYIKDLGFYPGPRKPQRRFSWEGKPPGTPHLGVLLLLPVCPSQTKLSVPWTECVSPKSTLKPYSHGDGIWEWGIGTTIRLDEVMSMKLPRGGTVPS